MYGAGKAVGPSLGLATKNAKRHEKFESERNADVSLSTLIGAREHLCLLFICGAGLFVFFVFFVAVIALPSLRLDPPRGRVMVAKNSR